MLQAIPALGPRLVGLMVDRVRDITRLDLREEKLISLGKLSAGLAHELGNPAAAARRAAVQFGETIPTLESQTLALIKHLGVPALEHLLAQARTLQPTPLGPLQRSDLEQALADWLEGRRIKQAWEYAPTLVGAGVRLEWLEALGFPGEALPIALGWLEAYLSTQALARDIQTSTERISDIVMAVKRYTHMDQAPHQEVDIQQGLEDTLTLFGNRLKRGVMVEKYYAPRLPRIQAFGGELNQIWTNLIDNALDAMDGSGSLRIRTAVEGNQLLVEIGDTGPGIPAEIQNKIFDPFFTTKGVGEGTGLGLDTVRRIVQHHKGSLRVESQPGDTRFQVRLPIT
jgi:signal transduction histidine kinase